MKTLLLLLLGSGLAAYAQPVRIATGNSADLATADGKTWLADRHFTGGDRRYGGNAINGTPDQMLYRWSRVGYYGDFSYLIPVSNGSYSLTLKFAETQFLTAGSRVFNVVVNGAQVLSNFDIVKEAGAPLTAIDRTFPVEVADGLARIQVNGVVNVGLLSAIELVPLSTSPPPPTPFVTLDTNTKGNWTNTYGGEGYRIVRGPQALPAWAQVTATGATEYTWGTAVSDPRSLDLGGGARLAATWYSASSFSLNVNLTDGGPHQVAIYSLDPDNQGRTQRVEVLNSSGNVVDVRVMSGFSQGQYLVWNLSGQFVIRVTKLSGPNAVVSAVFLGTAGSGPGPGPDPNPDPGPTPPVLSLSSSSLNFVTQSTPPPQTVNIGNTGGGALSWTASKTANWLSLSATSGTAPSTLQVSVSPGGLAPGNYTDTITVGGTGGTKTVGVSLTVNAVEVPSSATASFVGLDTTRQGWWRTVYGIDGYTFIGDPPALPSYVQFSTGGASTFVWKDPSPEARALQHATGNNRVASTWYHASVMNFDINFTDGAQHLLALYASDYDNSGRSQRIEVRDSASGAVLDTRTMSAFVQGQYLVWNIQGRVVVRVTKLTGANAVANGFFFGPPSATLPGPGLGVTVSELSFTALQGNGVATAKTVGITNTGVGTLNWTASENASWISLSSTAGVAPATLGVNVSPAGLSPGSYTENVTITGAGTSQTVAVRLTVAPVGPNTGAASFVGTNTALQGNWLGNFGSEGHAIFGDGISLPGYVQMSDNALTHMWEEISTNPAALQLSDGSGRRAATWHAPTDFSFDLNFTAGQHRLTLYAVDIESPGRDQRIEILDAESRVVLSSQDMSAFQGGHYLSWIVSGHIVLKVVTLSDVNVVASALFFDPVNMPELSLSSTSASFTATIGGANPGTRSISIANVSGTPLNWTASESSPWLSLSATSGTTPSTLDLNASIEGLAIGNYSATVTVQAPGAIGSPKIINVSLSVTELVSVDLNPLAHWTFDSVSGNTVPDITPNALNGTIQGGANAVTFAPGPVGNAATFNGLGGSIRTVTDSRLAIRDDLTFTAWVRTTNNNREETILGRYDLNGIEDGYILEITPEGYLAIYFGGRNVQAGTRQFVDGTNKINDGQWHHIAVILRGSQDVQFYIDGGLSSVFYSTIRASVANPFLTIGGPQTPGNSFFSGSLDDLRVYPRALTTAEIAAMWGLNITTVTGGEKLYNGIHLPVNFPPRTTPTQEARTPYYINNPPRVIPIDLGRQLFVDDFLIENTTLQRTQHQAVQRTNPLFVGSPISGGAWWDPKTKQFQMWYWDGISDAYSYSHSSNGIDFLQTNFPDVYIPNTNKVNRHGDTVWLDLEEPDPARRYKAFGVASGSGSNQGVVYVYYSADGIHWGTRQDYGIRTISDRTTVFYNTFRKVWVNSDRGTASLPATAKVAADNSRSRYYSESKDLLTWSPANPADTFWTALDEDDPPYVGPGGEPRELYTLDAVAYESVMVGLFSWFHPGIGYRDHPKPGPILVELGVGFSRDGFSWVRPTRESGPTKAFIPASNIDGTWNAYNTQSTGGGFLVVGDELWFYYSARDKRKPFDDISTYPGLTKFYTGLATLRRDGFYSMDAGLSQGTLTTRVLKFSGSRMFVNVNNLNGTLLVEALDENNNVIPGFEASNFIPVHDNKTSLEVSWNGQSVGTLANRNVKFKFYLTNGSLYSFWVTSSPVGASNGYVAAGGPGFDTLIDTTGK